MTNLTLHTLDFPQLHRSMIGFDRLFDELNRTFANSRSDNYPPHNVAQLDDTHFVIEVAVAGFKESEIDVELKEKVLTVKGEKVKTEDAPEVKYLHKGLSARNFTRTFTLADNVEVRAATVENGVLAVALELMVPKEDQPKKIAITYKK
jgi:molecular chaperone IbpA